MRLALARRRRRAGARSLLPFALLAGGSHADQRDRRRDLRHRVHGAQHARRPHGTGFVRARRVVRSRRLRGGARAASLVPGLGAVAGAVRARVPRRRRRPDRLPGAAAARRLLFAADARVHRAHLTRSRFAGRAFTGGESGLGGVTRATWLGVDLENAWVYYALVALVGVWLVYALSRFHASPIGIVLVAIRENEQRAQFIGYATQRYKQIAFMISATLTRLRRRAVRVPSSLRVGRSDRVSFSGELLAMVIIGGMRSLLGPALGALFYILFREFLSIWTPNWLLFFGLLFVGFVVFSPTGLVGVWRRLTAPLRAEGRRGGGDGGPHDRAGPAAAGVPAHATQGDGTVLEARDLAKAFGGIQAVDDASFAVQPTHAARADRAQRRRQDDRLQSDLRAVRAGPRHASSLAGRDRSPGSAPHRIVAAGLARSFQITNLFAGALDRGEPAARRAGARPVALQRLADARAIERVTQRTTRADPFPGPDRHRARRCGDALLRRPAAARHGTGARVRVRACCCSTSRSRGSPRPSASAWPACQAHLGRHPGAARRARHRSRVRARRPRDGDERRPRAGRRHRRRRAPAASAVQEIYIGTGTAALAARPARTRRAGARAGAAGARRDVDAFYGKSHIVREASLVVHEQRDRRAAGPQRRRQVDAAEDDHRHRPARRRARSRSAGDDVARASARPRSRAAASATCRRAAGSSPA